MHSSHILSPGKPLPYGATPVGNGVQFSIFTRNGKSVRLLLFEKAEDLVPEIVIPLDPVINKTGDVWHLHVQGLKAGALYLYQVEGPGKPEKGHRFDSTSYLLDPYAKALTGCDVRNLSALRRESLSSGDKIPKCVVIDDLDFDWEGDTPLNLPLRFSVVYELHAAGFTRHPSSGVSAPGTFRGIMEKIPYLKDLGITSLELLPIHEFDHRENAYLNPVTGKRLQNYWGYSTISFFSPKAAYAESALPGGQVNEFKQMVKELHKAGIEVILDVVYNHTGEGNEHGVTFSWRGFDNSVYYLLEENKAFYSNYSGCGNTLNCNHPIVRSLILDSLRYWVIEMHVDGFRFDLGSILGRDRNGSLMENPPMLERIAEDPVLRNTKIIAEAWDAAGAYQVGWFPGGRWAEWNDRYRDDIRRFWRGDHRMVKNLATRITGSSDLYLRDGRKPFHSINFITSHDGFTLNDLVSYEKKHNFLNGEKNRDGHGNNYSVNCGMEGESTDPEIIDLRKRQIKNFLATLLLSIGTPMILGGDEFLRTQEGNNNAYCQNNDISWFDWNLVKKNQAIVDFTSRLIQFRNNHPVFHRPEFYTGKDGDYNELPDITWFDEKGRSVDWEKDDHLLALMIDGSKAEISADKDDYDFYIMFNASPGDVVFTVTAPPEGKKWYRAIDTGAEPGREIFDHCDTIVLKKQQVYKVKNRSTAVLVAIKKGEEKKRGQGKQGS